MTFFTGLDEKMCRAIRVLIVEDSEDDVLLTLRALRHGGYEPTAQRVQSAEDMSVALETSQWDVIISDFRMPEFDGLAALKTLQNSRLDIPFILVSGAIGEDLAVTAMRAGVHDYIMKDNLKRLPVAVEREMREAQVRRQSAEAGRILRENEQRYRTLFNTVSDAIIIIDNETKCVEDVNDAAIALYGYDFNDFLKLKMNDITQDEDLIEDMIRRTVGGELILVPEHPHAKKSGLAFPAEVAASSFDFQGRQFTCSVIRDITARKRVEAEQSKLRAQLQQQQRIEAIGTLAGGVAHEINNPICGIMNYAQLIMYRSTENKNVTKFAEEIIRETERVTTIVHDLLQFARQGQDESSCPARLVDILNSTLSLVRAVIRNDLITLELDVADDLPLITCKSQRIRQVFVNLLTNARDALNERYPTYDKRKAMRISAKEIKQDGRRWVRLTVEDYGIGIPDEVRDRMFEPFFTTKPKEIGTGLGLSITHGIIKDHEGKISIDCKLGEYTRVHVDLPVTEDDNRHPDVAPGQSARGDTAATTADGDVGDELKHGDEDP